MRTEEVFRLPKMAYYMLMHLGLDEQSTNLSIIGKTKHSKQLSQKQEHKKIGL